MTCPCGAATTIGRARCNPCQRAAVLHAAGWDEHRARQISDWNLHQLRAQWRRQQQARAAREEAKT